MPIYLYTSLNNILFITLLLFQRQDKVRKNFIDDCFIIETQTPYELFEPEHSYAHCVSIAFCIFPLPIFEGRSFQGSLYLRKTDLICIYFWLSLLLHVGQNMLPWGTGGQVIYNASVAPQQLPMCTFLPHDIWNVSGQFTLVPLSLRTKLLWVSFHEPKGKCARISHHHTAPYAW